MKKSSKVFTVSDESQNLYGFKVLTAGIDLSDFKKNPVCLYNHDYDQLIGLWGDLSISNTNLLGTPSFDEEDPAAMKQFSKTEQGILNGASIGIVPLEFDSVNNVMVRSSLKEISLTPVPANRNAIAIYNAKGQQLSADQAKEYLLSLQPSDSHETLIKKETMYPKTAIALAALSLLAGHSITLSAQSTDDEMEGALKKVSEKLTELSGKVLVLETQAKTAKEREVETLVDEAIAQKRLSASDKDAFVQFGNLSLDSLKTALSALKAPEVKTIPTSSTTTTSRSTASTGASKADWTFDDFALKAPHELEAMQGNDPQRFQALLSAKQTEVRYNVAIGDN